HNNLTFGLIYAYAEKYVLVLSHDELVRGKQSMLDKMPGDLWEKCANLRVAYAFMYGHPGKKMLFMGSEFGQLNEWDEKKGLDWFLLDHDHHRQIKQYVNDLNMLYKKERAFWFDDFQGGGFEWINCSDAERSLVTFVRKSDEVEETLVFVCNFTPNAIDEYKMGLPFSGFYQEIFNSDATKYGGNGFTNDLILKAAPTAQDDRDCSVTLKVPALGALILKPVK
ncbi:MAG: alpha amylase C-terminal domain-containing protein, partial [Clostridiales bacterium]|nr:alpha amylase C-terminal domain-containing protein [Clostridiales bacterium]